MKRSITTREIRQNADHFRSTVLTQFLTCLADAMESGEGNKVLEMDEELYKQEREQKQVFFVQNLQGSGYEAVCSTLAKAKEWLMQSIVTHQGNEADPDPWDGWEWWIADDGRHCFGGSQAWGEAEYGPDFERGPEGYIQQHTLI